MSNEWGRRRSALPVSFPATDVWIFGKPRIPWLSLTKLLQNKLFLNYGPLVGQWIRFLSKSQNTQFFCD